jgi:hypothetical protein
LASLQLLVLLAIKVLVKTSVALVVRQLFLALLVVVFLVVVFLVVEMLTHSRFCRLRYL